jgi:DNA-binding IclR family transcriptional regulator
MNEPIPEHVLRFIEQSIENVPQLETLLLAWQEPQRCWSEDEIAARLYVPRGSAVMILQALVQRRLLRAEGDPPHYRYEPRGPAHENLVSELAVHYRRHLVLVSTLIHSRGSASVRAFARAFNLKREGGD